MKLYNTLSRAVEEFTPRESGKVSMFVCGPTVYDFSHLGHAKTYTQMDVLARTLEALDYEVFYLQNITDLDDKIIQRAKQGGEDWRKLASRFEHEYKKDMELLNNTSVSKYARATDHIDDIVRQVQVLVDKGCAYTIDNDGIYFEVAKFADYGKLSGRQDVKENDAESRIDYSKNKKGWNDFCLWKFSKPGEPVWEASFGQGRPGWHIEDTAITEHFFGAQYDIHGGAVDLIFPHHEAEITQMEAISGKIPFVKYWTHSGFLNINQAKMSKSQNNFFTIRDVIKKGTDPVALRLFFLQTHYRSPIDFSWESLEATQNRLNHWRQLADLKWQLPESAENLDIIDSLKNDLNTPQALAQIDTYLEKTRSGYTSPSSQAVSIINSLLGIDLTTQDITDAQKKLIVEREVARDSKDWSKSDKIRQQLENEGIGLNDTEQGSLWYRI